MTLLRSLISIPLVVLSLAGSAGLAHAADPPLAQTLGSAGLSIEPLLQPQKSAAIARAKATLQAAHKSFAASAEGSQVDQLGFRKETIRLEAPRFRNETVLYKPESDGTKVHVGYAMEMNVGREKDEWVSVIVNRRGRIHNRLFLGSDSVFAKSGGKLPAGLLAKLGQDDLESAKPLDTMARWTARRQARSLTTMKPARIGTPKPTVVGKK